MNAVNKNILNASDYTVKKHAHNSVHTETMLLTDKNFPTSRNATQSGFLFSSVHLSSQRHARVLEYPQIRDSTKQVNNTKVNIHRSMTNWMF